MYEERTPKFNEKTRTFALAIQKLFTRAMPNVARADREVLLKHKFMKHLPAQTQLIMKLGPERDWLTLVKDVDSTIESFSSDEIDANNNVTQYQKYCNYCKRGGHTIHDCFRRNNSNQQLAQRPHDIADKPPEPPDPQASLGRM
jgi:hypothetical protein